MDYVVIRRFQDLAQAVAAAASLEGSGLAPRVLDQHAAGLLWLYSPALGGVRLEVPDDQRTDADQVLAATVEEPLAPEEVLFSVTSRRERRTRGLWAMAFMLIPGLAFLGLLMALTGVQPWTHKRSA